MTVFLVALTHHWQMTGCPQARAHGLLHAFPVLSTQNSALEQNPCCDPRGNCVQLSYGESKQCMDPRYKFDMNSMGHLKTKTSFFLCWSFLHVRHFLFWILCEPCHAGDLYLYNLILWLWVQYVCFCSVFKLLCVCYLNNIGTVKPCLSSCLYRRQLSVCT